MSSLSITNLESIRKNPIPFARSLKIGTYEKPSIGGRPKSVKWFDSILKYHETSDISQAVDKLESSFSNRKNTTANQRELENLMNALYVYVEDYQRSGYFFVDKRIRLDIPITTTLKLTGWIWLVYMKSEGGKLGLIISKEVNELKWNLELRFPLIQNYIAQKVYGCALEDVEVGVIDFLTGRNYTKTYDKDEIELSLEEFEQIKTKIGKILI